MSHSVLAAVIVPIVVVIVLAIWLLLVYRADRHGGEGGHPETTNPRAVPRREVAGGAFRSRGGRQVAPRRDETPAEAAADVTEQGATDTTSGSRDRQL